MVSYFDGSIFQKYNNNKNSTIHTSEKWFVGNLGEFYLKNDFFNLIIEHRYR